MQKVKVKDNVTKVQRLTSTTRTVQLQELWPLINESKFQRKYSISLLYILMLP